jgi:hypothetical protein
MCPRNRQARIARAESKEEPPGTTTTHKLQIDFPGGGRLKLSRKRKRK